MTKQYALKPGWLAEDIEAAGDSLRASHHPGTLAHLGVKEATPITDAQAQRLFAILNARFRAWTGQGIQQFKAS